MCVCVMILFLQRKTYADLDVVTTCMTAGTCMPVCAGVSKHVYVCASLQGVLQSRRYNGPTPSLCEVLQKNLKQLGGRLGCLAVG